MPLDSPSSTAARATPASEAHRAQLTAALAAGKGYQQRGAERAAECQQQLLLRGSDPKQRRAEDDGEAGAGVDPQQAGVGQRVAGERLHQRAGEAEGDAGQQTGQSARQARVQHDSAISALTGSAEGGEYRADRQRFGADGQAKRGG